MPSINQQQRNTTWGEWLREPPSTRARVLLIESTRRYRNFTATTTYYYNNTIYYRRHSGLPVTLTAGGASRQSLPPPPPSRSIALSRPWPTCVARTGGVERETWAVPAQTPRPWADWPKLYDFRAGSRGVSTPGRSIFEQCAAKLRWARRYLQPQLQLQGTRAPGSTSRVAVHRTGLETLIHDISTNLPAKI